MSYSKFKTIYYIDADTMYVPYSEHLEISEKTNGSFR